jgi:phage portal protein BeeE
MITAQSLLTAQREISASIAQIISERSLASSDPLHVPNAVSEQAALQIPALAASVDAVCHALATMPLRATSPHPDLDVLLRQPELDRTRYSTLRATARDLLLWGSAVWAVVASAGPATAPIPRRVRHLPRAQLSRHTSGAWIRTDEQGVSRYADAQCIAFDIGGPGILTTGASAILSALALERHALQRARSPLPTVLFRERPDAIPLTQQEKREFLNGWEAGRATSAAAYLDAASDVETIGYSSAEMQLVEARAHSDLQMARLAGIDPAWIAAGSSGSSITYSNRQDLRMGLIDGPVRHVADTIEQRLSMSVLDVDPARAHPVAPASSRQVYFDFGLFLRADLSERAQVATSLLQAGIWDQAQAAHFVAERWD